jgi:hypothetical protein
VDTTVQASKQKDVIASEIHPSLGEAVTDHLKVPPCVVVRVGHDQVFSLNAPIPIFQKKKIPNPITDQIFEKNLIKSRTSIQSKIMLSSKETEFFANDNFLFLFGKFERKLNRIDPINDQLTNIISIKSSLINRLSIG